MKKLDFNHIAPYLPYKLRVQCKRHWLVYGEVPILEVNGIAMQGQGDQPHFWQYEFVNPADNDLIFSDINAAGFKPILRPLSDLIKQIERDGERFVPVECFEIGDDDNNYPYEFTSGNVQFIKDLRTSAEHNLHHDIQFMPYLAVQKMLELNFDIFNLIEQDLAVDINTI